MKRKISWFNMLVYRLFYWRWAPLLANDPKLLALFSEWINGWQSEQGAGGDIIELERQRIKAGQVCADPTHWH